MNRIILIIAVFIFLFSCEYKHRERHCKVHCYQTGSGDDLMYWYLLYGNNNTYYVYQSASPVTSFTGVSWSQQQSIPEQLSNVQEFEQINEPLSELPDEIDVDMSDQTEEATESNSEGESSSGESGSDAGGSDAGGSDGGGGDGGGGD